MNSPTRIRQLPVFLILAWATVGLVAGRQTPGVDATVCDWDTVRAEFDTNHDGRLDASERERLRRSRPEGFTCDPGRGTWDGGGEWKRRSDPGRTGGTTPPPHPLARFDADGNGILDSAELASARTAMPAFPSTKPASPSEPPVSAPR